MQWRSVFKELGGAERHYGPFREKRALVGFRFRQELNSTRDLRAPKLAGLKAGATFNPVDGNGGVAGW